jgi:hypothetical protein
MRHIGLQFHTDIKAVILNSIHLWGVLLSAEERMTMSAGKVKDFVATCVAELCYKRGYVHHGKDEVVHWLDICNTDMLSRAMTRSSTILLTLHS